MRVETSLLRFSLRFKLPVIIQDERAACGHACVAMLAHFWGHRIDMQALRRIYPISVRGITLREIDNMMSQLGLYTRALRVPLSEVRLIKVPAILHWNMNHFVVLARVKKRKIILHDPAVGLKICDWNEFSQSFTGVVLEVGQRADFVKLRDTSSLTLLKLLKCVQGSYKGLAVLLLLSLAIEFMHIVYPLLMQYMMDYALGSSDLDPIYRMGMGFALFVLLQSLTEYTRGHLVLYIRMQWAEALTTATFKHLLKLPLSFFENRHLGDIHTKFQSLEHIKTLLSADCVSIFLDGFMTLFTIIVMFMYNGLLSSIVCGALLLTLTIRLLSVHHYQSKHHSAIAFHAQCASSFIETLHTIRAIKCNLKESIRLQAWHTKYIDALNQDIQVARLQIRHQSIQQILTHWDHILVLCMGTNLIFNKQLTIGMLLAFLAYRLMLVNKATSFIQHVFDYQLLRPQLLRLNDIIQQSPEENELLKPELSQTIQGSIELKDVYFHYHPQSTWILEKINLSIKPGEKVVITGSSGCGKSTLLKVMMGLEKPISGEILIDCKPLDLLGLSVFRSITASVMQDDQLFSGSILDNITFFAETPDLDRVYEVAELTRMHSVIMAMTMRYETLLGHMGSSLSGGQKQRLLLARALYLRPKFLFLDEATSHLDVDTEQHINHALHHLAITQIMVAHRHETIRMADRVIAL